MGRASEAGYSLEAESQNSPSEYGRPGDVGNEDMRSPPYINTETQMQLHTQPSPTSTFHPPLTPSSFSHAPRPKWTRFAIPTKTDSLSSGFPFHPHLYTLKITHDQWHLFTTDVVSAAKMTGMEDYLAWTTGITAGTLTSPFLLVLAPVVGYYSGKAVHKKTLVKTVKEKLGEEGGLRGVLRKWNEQTFAQMGFQAWLELPRESGELNKSIGASTVELEAGDSAAAGDKKMDAKKRKKVEKKAARRFRIILVPLDEVEDRSVPSYAGSESGSGSVMGGSERGLMVVGVDEMDAGRDSHRETLPPAYWDANAVGAFNDVVSSPPPQQQQQQTQTQAPNPTQQFQQRRKPVSTGSDGSPVQGQSDSQGMGMQRDPPLEREIRYSRVGGYTNT